MNGAVDRVRQSRQSRIGVPPALSVLCALLLCLGVPSTSAQGNDADAIGTYPKGSAAIPLLHEIWAFSAARIFPRSLAQRFDAQTLAEIEAALRSPHDVALADAMNPFLESLGVSHTRLYDVRHQTYYLQRSLFSTRDLDAPQLHTIGVQFDELDPSSIRAVMEQSPAAIAGLQRGERIVAVNGVPFKSLLQWQESLPVTFTVRGVERDRSVTLTPVRQSFHRALAEATAASSKVYECSGRRVAYLHLWSGTHPKFLEILQETVAHARRLSVDGFILDLRDGYGGAWWDYLDPFFPNRDEYFQFVAYDVRGASEPMRAEPRSNTAFWAGPLAVLINRGTRSGKEALAFQFKKARRGTLFGETTSGAFVGGLGAFADRDDGFALYLAVQEPHLDGVAIEGVGISPDVAVAEVPGVDAPLFEALNYLGCDEAVTADRGGR